MLWHLVPPKNRTEKVPKINGVWQGSIVEKVEGVILRLNRPPQMRVSITISLTLHVQDGMEPDVLIALSHEMNEPISTVRDEIILARLGGSWILRNGMHKKEIRR